MRLLKCKDFPQKIVIYPREYVFMTRPEDISEYDYLNSLKKNDVIDFSAFRLTSSDISLTFVSYLFPILQRKWKNSYCELIDDRIDELFLKLAYQDTFEKYLVMIDEEDKKSLLDWFCYLLKHEKEKPFVYGNVDEINNFINYLNKC